MERSKMRRLVGAGARRGISMNCDYQLGRRLILQCGRASSWLGLYARIKLRIFPLEDLLAQIPSQGTILDLGCGNGLLSLAMSLQASGRRVFGIDLDRRKLAGARQLTGPKTLCAVGDLTSLPCRGQMDAIVISDILYLIPFEKQVCLLRACHRLLRAGGCLVLKDMATRPLWKSWWNRFQETIAIRLAGWTLGGAFYFRDATDYVSTLEACGFDVTVCALDRGHLYPHILYRCIRRTETQACA
jgi:SAM-dependent methyltransferase